MRPRPAILAALLVAAICLAFFPALHGQFIWDDDAHVTANPVVVGPLGLREIWTTPAANYFPLVLTTFRGIHALWGLDPLPYHVVTILFHAASALLLWQVLRQLGLGTRAAWLGATVWALHPVQAESVAWISELKNTESAFFFLLSIGFFLRWIEAADPEVPDLTRGNVHLYLLAVGFGLLAVLSKPSTVMLPVALGLCWWWRRGRIRIRDTGWLAPFVALAVVASLWAIWEQRVHQGASGAEWSLDGAERGLVAGRAVCFYLGKLLWPAPLAFIYPRWDVHGAGLLAWVAPGAVVAGLTFFWRARGTAGGRAGFFASAWFVALLLPVLGFFDAYFFRYSFVGDHFQYLASMGPLILAGVVLDSYPRLRAGLAAVVVLGLTALTWRQCAQYADSETLWRTTLARNPGAWMAHSNLGNVLSEKGDRVAALAHYEQAVALNPDYVEGRNNLGVEYGLRGRPADAVVQFEAALRLDPADAETHNNLGNALRDLDRLPDAIVHYRAAVHSRPDFAEAHFNLARALAVSGRPEEARTEFDIANRLGPRPK